MNQSTRYYFPLLSALFLSLALASNAFAQQAEPTYEMALNVLVGSNEAGRGAEVPANLSAISKQLKSMFPFANYRIVTTFFIRLSNTGNIEYKSISNLFGEESANDPQSFVDWSINNVQVHQNGLQARSFRFGARVPVRSIGVREGQTTTMVNYENIGLTLNPIGIPPSKPTLLGTINLPRSAGTMFLVATIKPAEM